MLPALLLLLQSAGDPSRVYEGRAHQLDVRIPRREVQGRVDGALDEPVWAEAARLSGFSQYRPVDGRPAQDSTEVLVWYAPDAIWFGIRAYEAHGGSNVVRATLADRDNIDADDQVKLLLDTFDDHRRALLFAVNPLGVQQDGVWSDGFDAAAGGPTAGGRFDATVDLNPDFVFQSKGRLTPWGYQVEVRVPFKSIRYQGAEPQDWGLQVVRVTQHSGHEDTWAPAVRANASFLIQSGRLRGLTGLHRGLVMDATPEFTTRVDGRPRPGADYLYTGEPEVGGTLRWGLTANLNLTGTANPDFSQVEADVGQVTVNERFALFFPEKRPFFLEGLEQFATPNGLIYTRRIFSPVAGAKLTGKAGGTNLAYLAAVDDEAAPGAHPVYNLVRVRRDLGASSNAGLVYTDRVAGDDYNRVLGADLRVVWRTIWFSRAQLVGSWTRDFGGARAGELWSVTLYDRTGRSYGNHAEVKGVSPDFVAASGFVPRTDYVQAILRHRFSWYGRPGSGLEQLTTFFGFEPTWRYDDFFRLTSTLEGQLSDVWTANLRGGWQLNANLANSHFRFDPRAYVGYAVDDAGTPQPFVIPHGLYNLWSIDGGAQTPNRALALAVSAGYSAVAIFDEAAQGRQVGTTLSASWRPTAAIRVDARWTHQRLTRAADGTRFSTASIPRIKLEYQLTPAVFFRYVGQHFAQDRAALRDPRTSRPLLVNGVPAGATATNDFRSDVLFSYKPVPGTVFFLGYGASLTEPEAFGFDTRRLRRTADGFFLKASYLFRM